MIQLRNVWFAHPGGGFALDVKRLDIARGERVAIVGPSGSGKTTLVSLIAGILKPQQGDIRVADLQLNACSERDRRNFRIANIGFVFQEFELIEYLNIRENMLLPYSLNRTLRLDRAARQRVENLAQSLGLADLMQRKPRAISQGERQRVAIARALAAGPMLVIADEPTGNLDPAMARRTLRLLFDVAAEHRATLLTVTHNHDILEAFDRVIEMGALRAGGTA